MIGMSVSHQPSDANVRRVLLLTASDDERDTVHHALTALGLRGETCENVSRLCGEIARGAAAAVIADAALTEDGQHELATALQRQQASTDFPLIILTSRPDKAPPFPRLSQPAESLSNVALLRRPLSRQAVEETVRNALDASDRKSADRTDTLRVEHNRRHWEQTATELGERVHAQAEILRLLRDVATAANFAESVEEALSFALAQVCRYTGWNCAHAYLPNPDDANELLPVDASYEHAPHRFAAFRAATLQLRAQRGRCLVGRVYATGQPEWIRGIDRDFESPRAPLAQQLGLVTAAAFPVMAGPEVVGVLEFFSQDIADPTPEVLDAMTSIGTQLGRVVERDRLDRALRDSVRLFKQISDTSPTMIRIFDDLENRYVHVNRQMARFFGVSVEEATQLNLETFRDEIHPNDVEQFDRAKAAVRRSHRQHTIAWQARLRDAEGVWRWVRSWSVVFTRGDDGAARQILSISMDVTDQVETEERLRQTERLASIGTLAAGIAHEINNPLASVVMTAQLLRKRDFDPQVHEMLDDLIHDAKRCGRIVRSVQKFAKQRPAERVPLDINAVIHAAEELSRTELRRAGIDLRVELADPLPSVTADATELEQVVLNLITNAAHASTSGQAVVVRTAAVDGHVRIQVRDQGRGMPPDVQRHVFDPFFTTRVHEGGTGLGLSIAHGIIEDHGGTIAIDSAVGKGTIFTISLPITHNAVPGLDNR